MNKIGAIENLNKDFVNTNLDKFAKSSDISRYVL